VTCAQLVEKLSDIGVSETEANIRNKLARGKIHSGVSDPMPRSDWLSYAAIAGLIIIVCLSSYLSPWIASSVSHDDVYGVTNIQNAEHQQQTSKKPTTTNEKQPQTAEYQPDCNNPKNGDLCAQLRMASAAEVQSWLNELGIILLVATLCFTAAAAIAAWLTVHVMKDTAKNELRAYVQAENAFVVHDGSRRFHVEMVVLNSGTTPCPWFGYKCHAFYGDVSSAVEFNRDSFKGKPLKRWNGLANGGDGLTFVIYDPEVSEAVDLANSSMSGFRIDGVIEYETFFGEVFETEFSFFMKPMIDRVLFTSISEEDERNGTKLSRTTRILNSYRKLSG